MPVDKPPRRDGHEEISKVSSDLNQRRLRDADVEGVLEMLVQNVKNSACKPPEKEERGYKNERKEILPVGDGWLLHDGFKRYPLPAVGRGM